MSTPLRIPLLVLLVALGCSKKEADPPSETVSPAVSSPVDGQVSGPALQPPASASAAASTTPSGSARVAPTPIPITMQTAPLPQGDGGPTCGVKPLPDCPLQGWMKRNTSDAMKANDLPTLAFAFDQMIPFGPPGYTNWASISRDGAAAARIGDASAVKAACRGCHDQYRNKYRTELRARPLP